MKIKGSIEFGEEEETLLVKNLKEIIKQKGRCTGIFCTDCILSSNYARNEKSCGYNSIWKNEKSIVVRAKEILEEINENN